ncbi:MAG TPA: ATP-binding protein [Dissulfurispiraceae bacterium]
MRIDRNSIQFRVVVPILIFIALTTLSLLIVIDAVSKAVSDDYTDFSFSFHARDIDMILDRASTEIVTSQVLGKPAILEAKQRVTLGEIASYWKENRLEGLVADENGKIIYSRLKDIPESALTGILPQTGTFSLDINKRHFHGRVSAFPVWGWKIVTAAAPLSLPLKRNTLVLLLPLITLGSVLMLVSVSLILKKRFQQPVGGMISSIKEGAHIKETGITELDTIGSAINDAFSRLHKKTEQYQTLHSIAVSLHEDVSPDEILNMIIDKASQLVEAEVAAIVLYDERGAFKKIITRGATIKTAGVLPEGKGLLELARLSSTPVRIENVAAHPFFSGSFPEGHPIISNLLAYPILSIEGSPLGALYFGNKPEGFTDEDELILKAITADTAIAINKTESLMQLMRFKQVIDSAFDVIVITDEDGCITYANPAFETVTEYRVEEVAGRKTSVLKSGLHDGAFYRKLWETIKAGDVWRGEFTNRKKSGELYHTSAIIFPIHSEREVNYASIQRDITQEKRLYEQLLRAQKMEAIGTLAGGIAHDFNNLLTAILGYSEILLSTAREGDALYRPATIIYHAAEKGAELAKKILTVTRKEKMETKPVDMNEIVDNSMELLQRSIPKSIEIIANLGKDLPLVRADATQIQQVIMNLAVNARDAMPDGGTLTIETETLDTEDRSSDNTPLSGSGFVKLSISDTGTGMDTDTQRRIFDPFFTTKETGKGTGLGLYIVHSVVSNHGGYVNLYSEPGKGTRFAIYLPIAKGDTAEDVYRSEDNIRGSETVLIIDDDIDVRELCRDMLEPLGYTVLSAGNGSDGINLFRQMKDKISVVVLDMIMPKMGGNEVYHALRTIDPALRVVLCSGYSHNGFAGIDSLLKRGVKAFIQKPFTRFAIAHAIRKALAE